MAAARRTLGLFTQPGMFLDEIHYLLEFLSISDISSLLRSSKDLYSIRISNGGSTYSLGTSSSVAGASSSVVADRIMEKIFLSLLHIRLARKVRLPTTFNMREMLSIRSLLAEKQCCSTLDVLKVGAVTFGQSCQMMERVGELVHEETYDMRYTISADTDDCLHLQALDICSHGNKLSICGGWCDDCDSYKCMKSHKWCFECKVALDSCREARFCSMCDVGICEECLLVCDACGENLCNDCGHSCRLCDELRCHDCTNDTQRCNNCSDFVCYRHDLASMFSCSECSHTLCDSCHMILLTLDDCDICHDVFCVTCSDFNKCDFCERVMCSGCSIFCFSGECKECGLSACESCDEDGEEDRDRLCGKCGGVACPCRQGWVYNIATKVRKERRHLCSCRSW